MNKIEQLAQQLREVYRTKQVCTPIRAIIGTEDVATAYAIQKFNNQLLIDNGARVTGYKIGLTSKVIQERFGISQPDFGVLFDTMEVLNGDSIAASKLIQPKAEGEIALVLKNDLPNHTITAVELISNIDYILPAIEIVGSRIKNWDISITDTIADNASSSHYVVGHQPVKLENVDIISCEMKMTRNGELVSTGKGGDCLGSPINATLWLCNKMAQLGTPLKAGQLIFSGSLGPFVTIKAGDTFEASFSGLGKVSVSFD